MNVKKKLQHWVDLVRAELGDEGADRRVAVESARRRLKRAVRAQADRSLADVERDRARLAERIRVEAAATRPQLDGVLRGFLARFAAEMAAELAARPSGAQAPQGPESGGSSGAPPLSQVHNGGTTPKHSATPRNDSWPAGRDALKCSRCGREFPPDIMANAPPWIRAVAAAGLLAAGKLTCGECLTPEERGALDTSGCECPQCKAARGNAEGLPS